MISMNAISALSDAIFELFAQVSHTGRITALDRQYLLQALLDDFTSEEEKFAIDRLLYAVRLGRVQVVDDFEIE
jgi:hypothetical protein